MELLQAGDAHPGHRAPQAAPLDRVLTRLPRDNARLGLKLLGHRFPVHGWPGRTHLICCVVSILQSKHTSENDNLTSGS